MTSAALWQNLAMRAAQLSAPPLAHGAGRHPGTSAQTIGLIILASIAAITAAHAAAMTALHLTGGRGAPVPRARRRLTIWDLGVRLSHWTVVASIAVLSVTGYDLTNRVASAGHGAGHGAGNPAVATLRTVHMIFAIVFIAAIAFRIVWFFAGNHWASWRFWIPLSRSRLRGLRQQAAYYAFLRRTPPAEPGHNALAGAAYTMIYLFFAAQIATGFILYYQRSATPTAVRFVHGVVMWVILAFVVHHVYSAILIGTEDHSGVVASIFTGRKKVTGEQAGAAEEEPSGDGGHVKPSRPRSCTPSPRSRYSE